MPIQLHNRLDVRDLKGKWLEATVVEIDQERRTFTVHFKGFASKWDEVIENRSELVDSKFAEIGLYSGGYGFAKFHKESINMSENNLVKNI